MQTKKIKEIVLWNIGNLVWFLIFYHQ